MNGRRYVAVTVYSVVRHKSLTLTVILSEAKISPFKYMRPFTSFRVTRNLFQHLVNVRA